MIKYASFKGETSIQTDYYKNRTEWKSRISLSIAEFAIEVEIAIE